MERGADEDRGGQQQDEGPARAAALAPRVRAGDDEAAQHALFGPAPSLSTRIHRSALAPRARTRGCNRGFMARGSTKLVHLGHAAVRAIFLTHVPTQTVPHGKIINLSLQAKKQHKRPFEIMSSLWRYPARQGCFLTRSCPICDCSRRKVGYHTRVGSAVGHQSSKISRPALASQSVHRHVDQLWRGDEGVGEGGGVEARV